MVKKCLFLAICITSSVFAATNSTIFDDWIVSDTCSQNANILCHGYYSQPLFPLTNKQPVSKQPIKVTSDTANFVAKGTSVFTGNVFATQGDKVIKANKATVVRNVDTGEFESITATGKVKLMQPGIRVDGTKAVAYVDSERQVIDDAVYRIYSRHARGTATTVAIQNNIMDVTDSTYTTCAPSSNAWYLKTTSTEFNKDTGRGEAWNARLYVKDVPIFYFPYVNFPIDKRRQSGFLQPEFEDSSLSGKTFIIPYYFNLAPNYDVTITSNYMTLRGFKFDTVTRYLTQSSNGKIDFDFLPHDRGYQALRNQYSTASFLHSTNPADIVRRNDLKPRDFRYKVSAKHTSYLPYDWQFDLDYTDASDGNYLYDFNYASFNHSQNRDSNIYALQRANLSNFNRFGSFTSQVERYKTFHVVNGPSGTEQLTKLPGLGFNSNKFNLPLGFACLMNAEFTNFRPHTFQFNPTPLSYGQRLHLRPGISYPIMHPGWFIQPRMQVNYVQYTKLHITSTDLANGVSQQNPHLAIPMYDVKTGLIFDRTTQWRGVDFMQTLEPQLYYLYVPEKNQNVLPNFDSGLLTFDYNQIYRDNRYTGGDYVGDANQLGMGVVSRFYDANSGEEIGMLGIGRIRYFRNKILLLDKELDNTEDNWSPFAMIASMRIAPDYSVTANVVRSKRFTDLASVQLQYQPSYDRVINFGYQALRNPQPDDLSGKSNSNVKQISISSAWQLNAPWRVLGKINYDLRGHRYIETLAGLEYHTCCTALRVLWGREWMPELYATHGHNNKFRIQFIFKGFAGVGNKGIGSSEDRYLAGKIPGYSAVGFPYR